MQLQGSTLFRVELRSHNCIPLLVYFLLRVCGLIYDLPALCLLPFLCCYASEAIKDSPSEATRLKSNPAVMPW